MKRTTTIKSTKTGDSRLRFISFDWAKSRVQFYKNVEG